MKEWIKEHPWRLEVVPFLMVIATALLPLMHWDQMIARTPSLPGRSVGAIWLMHYIGRVAISLFMWILGWEFIHEWVLSEREKRYNFWTLVSILVLGAFGWVAAESMFGSFWLVATALAAGAQAIIEARRPFVLMQRPEPLDSDVAEVEPGDRFYYREGSFLGRASLLPSSCLLAGSLGFVRHWEDIVCGLIFGLVYTPFYARQRREVVITQEKITGRFGLVRVLIPMTDLRSCAIADPHPVTESFRGHRGWGHTYDGMKLYGNCNAPMLRLDTMEGKTYVIGMKKPETACRLIKTALAARKQSAE